MSEFVVIGITGRARSGKDIASSFLCLLRSCHRIALADGVRSALTDLGGPTAEFYKELTYDHTYRRALQFLGTEAREAAGFPGLWIHLLLTKIEYCRTYHPVPRTRFVIPDIRHRHEESIVRHYVQRRGGWFGMLRLGRSNRTTGLTGSEAAHSSEAEVDCIPADREYPNDGTKAELAGAVVRFFDDIAGGYRRPETEEELFDAIDEATP